MGSVAALARVAKAGNCVLPLSMLLLIGCQSRTPAPSVVLEQPRNIGPARGIDLPTDASDVLNELRESKVDFVARYYRDPASRWPALNANEVRRLSSLGMNIVAIWESKSENPAYFTYATGYNDALSAHRQASAVGQPPGSAIYFAVDFNARGQDLQAVDQYFRGVNAGLAQAAGGRPQYRVGVYGSGSVCDAVKGAKLAQYSWLSNSRAWIGSATYSAWNIKQRARLTNLSFNHDFNEAKDDYGGFRVDRDAPTISLAKAGEPF